MHPTPAQPSEPAMPLADLIQTYRPDAGVYDEMVAADGTVRPHWQRLLGAFHGMDVPGRARASELAQRLLRENGVTYMARGDAASQSRAWQLDLFPLVIGHAEWRELETGLIQRARLLNAVLADVYGPQRVLKEGLLPASMVFGSPEFLRPCHGIPVPGQVHLHFLAFDLARAPNGQWWVLSDRTQAPSGAGYALENRVVASHCLSEIFARENVQRLAGFFSAFSERFLAMSRRDDPLAVILSPGPTKEAYFEHAYLARYLGYSVVEGSDLTVRDDRLYLKTVDGLKPVDLVFRRVRSELCDPLELRTESLIGVPGLVHAARQGQVVIANALGSGLVESEALPSFLPGLSRALLGEELSIPSVATWWCGQAREMAHVLENLERLIVRKVASRRSFLAPGQNSFVGPELTGAQRQWLARHIEQAGHEYIGQERVSMSTVPIWQDDGGLRPAPMTLRVYLAATEDGYQVMPGGLTRVCERSGAFAPWLEPSNISKDTWILREGPAEPPTVLTPSTEAVRLRRSARDLPSRTADNLFWLGRYAERSEGAVRLFRSLLAHLGGESRSSNPLTLERLVSLLVVQEHLSQRRARRAVELGIRAVETELWTILFDPDCPDGLANILGNVRRTSEFIRERLSKDTWRILTDLTEISVGWRLNKGREVDDAFRCLNTMARCLAAFSGMIMENMTRGYSWRFLDLGRRLERVRYGARLIHHLTARGDVESTGALDLLLELADSTMTYRTRYKASPQLAPTLDLLLADETNPRSLMFQLVALDEHVGVLPLEDREALLSPSRRIITSLRTELRLANVAQLARESGRRGARGELSRLLRGIEGGTSDLSDLIARTYFSHSMPQHTAGPQWTGTTF